MQEFFSIHLGQRLEFNGILRKFTDFGAYEVYLFFTISGFLAFASAENKY